MFFLLFFEYVGVINKDAEIDVVLTDKAVTATNPGDDANPVSYTHLSLHSVM